MYFALIYYSCCSLSVLNLLAWKNWICGKAGSMSLKFVFCADSLQPLIFLCSRWVKDGLNVTPFAFEKFEGAFYCVSLYFTFDR